MKCKFLVMRESVNYSGEANVVLPHLLAKSIKSATEFCVTKYTQMGNASGVKNCYTVKDVRAGP